MKIYLGYSDGKPGGQKVAVISNAGTKPLDPRFDLRNHSPDGFQWGYGGSGPAQLALALLSDVVNDDKIACAVYQKFKFDVIARLTQNKSWSMTELEIANYVANYGNKPLDS